MAPWARKLVVLSNITDSKISTPTLNKSVLSSSSSHTSSESNLTRASISYQLDNKDITKNQNNNNTSNKYYIHSCVTPRKQNYSIQATQKPPCLTPLNTTLTIAHVELHKTKQLPPDGKEYFCLHLNSESPNAA